MELPPVVEAAAAEQEFADQWVALESAEGEAKAETDLLKLLSMPAAKGPALAELGQQL